MEQYGTVREAYSLTARDDIAERVEHTRMGGLMESASEQEDSTEGGAAQMIQTRTAR